MEKAAEMQVSTTRDASLADAVGKIYAAKPETAEAKSEKSRELSNALQDPFKHNRTYAPHAAYDYRNFGDKDRDSWLEKRHWTDTPWGRYAIEFISRITLGGMFFALMEDSKSLAAMETYDPTTHQANPNKTWLEKAAYGIDKTLGVGLKKGFGAIYGDEKAENLLRFREWRPRADGLKPGRSLGAEMTVVTASFAAMSVGSGLGRNILMGVLNPREREAWTKNGKFDLTHTAKRTLSKAWEIISYNAGEDMAVALPYVFSLRGIRNFIDKHVAIGFRNGSDFVDNGGSMVVNPSGIPVSEHHLAGMIDLQARFTIYNVYTQMYRDAYDKIAKSFHQWQQDGYTLKTPELLKDPSKLPEKLLANTQGLTRYAVISSIRSILQMTPSVPFFSIVRVPASKPNGLAVNPQKGYIKFKNGGDPVRRGGALSGDPRYDYGSGEETIWSRTGEPVLGFNNGEPYNPYANPKPGPDGEKRIFDPYGSSKENRRTAYSAMSRLTDSLGAGIHKIAENPVWTKATGWFFRLAGKNESDISRLAKNSALAGMPYATYFAAKVYFREKFVNDQMNISIGRMIDGVLKLNPREIKEGILEIHRTMSGLPFRDSNRQAELIESHRFNPTDKSPMPENWNPETHRQYLKDAAEGRAPNSEELTAIISQRRLDQYQKLAENAKHRAEISSTERKLRDKLDPSVLKQKAENWTKTHEAAATENAALATV